MLKQRVGSVIISQLLLAGNCNDQIRPSSNEDRQRISNSPGCGATVVPRDYDIVESEGPSAPSLVGMMIAGRPESKMTASAYQ